MIQVIRERLKATQSRQKSYVDKRRSPLEFVVGDMIMLKVSPMKGVRSFGKKVKLTLRYIGPFKVVEHIKNVVYRLEFLDQLSGMHDVFHVLMLHKPMCDEER